VNRAERRAAARNMHRLRGAHGKRDSPNAYDAAGGGCSLGCDFHVEFQKIARTGGWLVWPDFLGGERMQPSVCVDWSAARGLFLEFAANVGLEAQLPERLDDDQHSMTVHQVPRGARN
jgi:hypothetical protein